MNISNEFNQSINDISEEELRLQVYKAISYIISLYEKYTKGDEEDFLRGGCAIFANMLYNIFPNKSLVYCSRNHAVIKIGETFYDASGILDKDQITNGGFTLCDFSTHEGRENFYIFSESCLYTDTGRFSIIIDKILSETKMLLNYTYEEDNFKLTLY